MRGALEWLRDSEVCTVSMQAKGLLKETSYEFACIVELICSPEESSDEESYNLRRGDQNDSRQRHPAGLLDSSGFRDMGF